MKLAIKVDVDTYRGTLEGVPQLCKILKSHKVPATFLFSMGPDNTGKSLRRIFQKGFIKKCLRSNVVSNYGLKTLLYGTVLPAPKISAKSAKQMRDCLSAGFECGVHSWDHYKWQNNLFTMRETQVDAEFIRACAEFEKVLGFPPKSCGAPGWQINYAALNAEDNANMLYASDTRGDFPFFPSVNERVFKTLQIPTTLMTLDELLGKNLLEEITSLHFDKMSNQKVSVMTIHAELEGMAYCDWFDSFLSLCKTNAIEFVQLEDYAKSLLENKDSIPIREIKMKHFKGRSGLLAVQE